MGTLTQESPSFLQALMTTPAWSAVTAGPRPQAGHRPWAAGHKCSPAPSCFHAQPLGKEKQREPQRAESAKVCTLSSFQETRGTSGSSKVWTLGNSELFKKVPQSLAAFKTGIGKCREGGGGNERSSQGEGTDLLKESFIHTQSSSS